MEEANPVQLQKTLKGLKYPATKDGIVEYARSHGGDERVVNTLENLPDKEYRTPADVSQAVGRVE